MTDELSFQRTKAPILGLLLSMALVQPALSQNVLGTGTVDGRDIEILDDGSWRYVDTEETEDCEYLPQMVVFCGVSEGWAPTTPPSPQIAAQYRFDDRHYGQFVIEGVGTNEGMSMGFFLDAVVSNAAAVTGVPRENIIVLDQRDATVSGYRGQTIVYRARFDRLDVVFANSILVLEERSIQSITFSVGREETDKSRELHARFLSLTQVN